MSDVPEALGRFLENVGAWESVGVWMLRVTWQERMGGLRVEDMERVALEKLYALEDVRG